MRQVGFILLTLMAVQGCEDAAEKERQSKAEYAAFTADACRDARQNVTNVENTLSALNKPAKDTSGRSFAKIVCEQADKAAKADAEQKAKDLLEK